MEYKLEVYSMFEIGQRDNQEDCTWPLPGALTPECRGFVLCDGMGGHDSGEVASNAVCCAMGGYIEEHCSACGPFGKKDFIAALNVAYAELAARDTHAAKKMGTTMTFLKFHSGGCFIAHIGDSRVYHLRPSQGILFETVDHSLVNDLIKIGELTPEEARDFPSRNVITRCMQPSGEYHSRADIKEITDVQAGDCFFMCSDGVNETLDSEDIARILLDTSLTDADKIDAIKAGTAEAHDNHTAFLVRVVEVTGTPCSAADNTVDAGDAVTAPQAQECEAPLHVGERAGTSPAKIVKWLVAALLLAAVIAAVMFFVK
ncbi:MAG: serine/threonine-protein phosphatase [Bacteroidaceae bacterium]|nr:serine/threonine-protein phosphatase [Bacteroidaceae bacterium]